MNHIRPRPLSWKLNRTEEEREKSNVNQEPLYFTVVPGKLKINQEKESREFIFLHFPRKPNRN